MSADVMIAENYILIIKNWWMKLY